MLKRVFALIFSLLMVCAFVSCGSSQKQDTVTVEDGYLVVNGIKTEYRVYSEPHISIIDGYVAVNGIKTEYMVADCNHIWEIITTAPTCSSEGYDTMTCKLCDKSVKTNESAMKEHAYGTNHLINDDCHWLECTQCKAKKDEETHTFNDDGFCTVCKMPSSATPGIIYDISADGTYAEVIGYEGTATKIKVAEEYSGLPVKKIYNNAFSEKTEITSIVLPSSIVEIGSQAFSGCSSLSKITIGNSVVSIKNSAFKNCSLLEEISLPDSLVIIEDYAFSNCSLLKNLTIPDNVTSIGKSAFSDCKSISNITIPNRVVSIGDNAFQNCSSLSSVSILDSVTIIGSSAFSGCNSALYTEYNNGIYIGDSTNPYAVLVEISNKVLSTYEINENTKIISYGVFKDCSRLSKITIPDGVTSIGGYAFYNCSVLESVTIPDSVMGIGNLAFSGCDSISYTEDRYCKYIGDENNPYKILVGLTQLNHSTYFINDNTKVIAGGVFSSCTWCFELTIPDSVVGIGEYSMSQKLSRITIPGSVKYIGMGAFNSCTKLGNVYYLESKECWESINIAYKNDPLFSANIEYDYSLN